MQDTRCTYSGTQDPAENGSTVSLRVADRNQKMREEGQKIVWILSNSKTLKLQQGQNPTPLHKWVKRFMEHPYSSKPSERNQGGREEDSQIKIGEMGRETNSCIPLLSELL